MDTLQRGTVLGVKAFKIVNANKGQNANQATIAHDFSQAGEEIR